MNKVKKRRRVTFAEDVVEPSPTRHTTTRNQDAPAADVSGLSGIPEHSLLGDGAAAEDVTAFDVAEDLEEGGELDGDDGLIPAALRRRVLTKEDEGISSDSDDENRTNTEATDEPDAWVDAMGDKPAAAAVKKGGKDANGSKRRRTDESTLSVGECVALLVMHLHRSETGVSALRRLKRERNDAALGVVTDACHHLLGHGMFGVYDTPREKLLTATRWDLCWDTPPPTSTDGNTEASGIHGALDSAAMQGWATAGYFKQREAFVRPQGTTSEWVNALRVFGDEAEYPKL